MMNDSMLMDRVRETAERGSAEMVLAYVSRSARGSETEIFFNSSRLCTVDGP